MTKYPDEYENYVLSALLRREDIFMTHHTWMCQDPRYPGRFFNDFDDVINYYLFRLMYIKYTEFGTIEVPTEESLRAGLFLIEMKYNKPLLSESQLPEVYAKLKRLTGPDAVSDADIDNLVEPAIKTWLMNKRSQSAIQDIKRMGIVPDICDRVDNLVETRDLIYAGAVEELIEELKLPDPDTPTIDRIHLPSRYKYLNDNLGGGLGRTEHILFAAPSGQGKTVMACQLAGDLALMGKHVLFVSTEQPAIELTPRILSSISVYPGFTSVPKRMIENGYVGCTPAQKESLEEIQKKLSPYLHFSCWVGDNAKLSISDLDGLMANMTKKFGQIDCVILDWIGGSLDGHTIDQGEKRQLYMDAANKMRTLAYKYNCAAISFCQTTADGYDKMHVETKHLGECKSIHHGCVAAFGISALKNSPSEIARSGETYAITQYINCFKTRNSVGTLTKVQRNFDFACFVPIE